MITAKGSANLPIRSRVDAPRTSARRVLPKAGRQFLPRWKRLIDLSLIAISSPLWVPLAVMTALWVKVISPGSIFFFQDRIGQHGMQFSMCKFRSMHESVQTQIHEDYVEDLIKNNRRMTKLDFRDCRLIPGGAWLRALCLDELPQILNILRGEMTIVGPRPCTQNESQLYTEDQKRRFEMVPGLTGLWQVEGKNNTSFAEMIALNIKVWKIDGDWKGHFHHFPHDPIHSLTFAGISTACQEG